MIKKKIIKIIIIIVFICAVAPLLSMYLIYYGRICSEKISDLIYYNKNKDELSKNIYKELGEDVVLKQVSYDGKIKIYDYYIKDKDNEKLLYNIIQVCNQYLLENHYRLVLRFVDYDYEYVQAQGFCSSTVFCISNMKDDGNDNETTNMIKYLSIDRLFDKSDVGDEYSVGEDYEKVYRSGQAFATLPNIRYLEMDKESKYGFDEQDINWYEVYPELNSFLVTEDVDGKEIIYTVEEDGEIRQ